MIEHASPRFSVNTYDKDGDIIDEGIFLHYGDVIINVASTFDGFKKHNLYLKSMEEEIGENI